MPECAMFVDHAVPPYDPEKLWGRISQPVLHSFRKKEKKD